MTVRRWGRGTIRPVWVWHERGRRRRRSVARARGAMEQGGSPGHESHSSLRSRHNRGEALGEIGTH